MCGAHPKHMRGTPGENLRRNSAPFLELMQPAGSARIKVAPTLRNSLVFPTDRVDRNTCKPCLTEVSEGCGLRNACVPGTVVKGENRNEAFSQSAKRRSLSPRE